MIAAIEIQLDSFFFAVSASRKILVGILIPYDAYIQLKRTEDVFQILLGRVGHDLVHIVASTQLDITLHYRLGRCVFLRPIQRRIHLQSADQVITLTLGLGEHHDVPGMQSVERGEGDPDTWAGIVVFPFFCWFAFHFFKFVVLYVVNDYYTPYTTPQTSSPPLESTLYADSPMHSGGPYLPKYVERHPAAYPSCSFRLPALSFLPTFR